MPGAIFRRDSRWLGDFSFPECQQVRATFGHDHARQSIGHQLFERAKQGLHDRIHVEILREGESCLTQLRRPRLWLLLRRRGS